MQHYSTVNIVEISVMRLLTSYVVDGGHRAIKYTRIDGVKPDIYNEGTHLAVCNTNLAIL